MRISRPQMFMEIAQVVAKRSTCMRLNVGAVIVRGRSIVSVGYNGVPAGEEHCRGNSCPGVNHCHETIHAELNAIAHLPGNIDIDPKRKLDLYVTDSPCAVCFEKIVMWGGIGRIFFGTPYRITDHLDKYVGAIKIYRVLPAGYVFDWQTRALVDVET
jgi:dCMP deaminase